LKLANLPNSHFIPNLISIIIPAEDPNSDYILKHFGRQRLSHVQRNIGLAGWLAGRLLSRIECLKKRIGKSDRFCTSGSNLVLNVIQSRFGALAGWLAVAGWPTVTGWPAGRGWLPGWPAAWLRLDPKSLKFHRFFNQNDP